MHYYGYGALGTDRYPPFTLADVADYPAHLDIPYPEKLSRGLVLVKWWLLAIPHYLILGVMVGGGLWASTAADRDTAGTTAPEPAAWSAFSCSSPRSRCCSPATIRRRCTGLILGMDRWALRVVAYAALMTDDYPPFRLDQGGTDPGSVPTGTVAPQPSGPTIAGPPVPTVALP